MTERAEHVQEGAGVRFDWGPIAARALARRRGCVVVVDVLSFSTTVSIGVARGMTVFPYPWRDPTAQAFAKRHGAALAVGRSEANAAQPWSLSASALLDAPFVERLVLPSPNGSSIAASVRGTVVTASLRNRAAVASRLVAAGFGTSERPIIVIGAGERWAEDGSLRPCVEDLVGAGALIDALARQGARPSVEASVAQHAFVATSDDALRTLVESASGRELEADGYEADVAVAAEIDVDEVVPLLQDSAFTDATASALQRAAGGR